MISRRLATLAQKPDAGFLGGIAQSDDFLDFAQIGFILLDTQPDQWRKALGIAETELRRALTYGFTAAELDEQKKNLLSEFKEASRAASTRESPGLADGLVRDLTEDRVFTAPDQDLQEITEILALASPETAVHELRALWADNGPLVFVSGPVQIEGAEAAITAAYQASHGQAVIPPADNAVAAVRLHHVRRALTDRRAARERPHAGDPAALRQQRAREPQAHAVRSEQRFSSLLASAAAGSTCRPTSRVSSSWPMAPFSQAG